MERVWVGSTATQGPEHYRRRINCQDQAWFFRHQKWIFGAVADGCSQSRLSEVGAGILAYNAPQLLFKAWQGNVSLEGMSSYFAAMIKAFMAANLASFAYGAEYLTALEIARNGGDRVDTDQIGHFLTYSVLSDLYQATLLTTCLHEDHGGIILVRGDGHVQINGELTSFDYNDQPPYLAYDYALDQYPGDHDDLRFQTLLIPPGFQTVGITTDGWPWEFEQAYPFGQWRYFKFPQWLRERNAYRRDRGKEELTEAEGWLLFRPEDPGRIARRLAKNPIIEIGGNPVRIVSDDLSGIFIEREEVDPE